MFEGLTGWITTLWRYVSPDTYISPTYNPTLAEAIATFSKAQNPTMPKTDISATDPKNVQSLANIALHYALMAKSPTTEQLQMIAGCSPEERLCVTGEALYIDPEHVKELTTVRDIATTLLNDILLNKDSSLEHSHKLSRVISPQLIQAVHKFATEHNKTTNDTTFEQKAAIRYRSSLYMALCAKTHSIAQLQTIATCRDGEACCDSDYINELTTVRDIACEIITKHHNQSYNGNPYRTPQSDLG